jgi:hypothetical protein
VIVTGPGLFATVINEDNPARRVTLNLTGSWHQSTAANGDVITYAIGRNLLYDPVAEPHTALTIGIFSWIFDKDGALIQPRQGKGTLTDVCAMLT